MLRLTMGDHPPLAALATDPLSDEVLEHLSTCAICRKLRDGLLEVTRDETMAPEPSVVPLAALVPGLAVLDDEARDRIAMTNDLHPQVLGWQILEGQPTRDPPPPGILGDLDVAGHIQATVDAVEALARFHNAGVPHGGLHAPIMVTDAGRMRLPWPALSGPFAPEDDWHALAGQLEALRLPADLMDPLLAALHEAHPLDILTEALALQSAFAKGEGRYHFGRKLGEGGMGEVWEAEDRLLNRRVALKRRKEGLLEPRRFVAEAQLTAQLQHPGIVSVHTVGEDAHGRPFYTMEVVQGQTLAEVLAEGTWPLPRLVDIVVRVCEAVAYAHERGVVHRDLKPANLMVGRHGEVRVMDWGIAKVTEVAAPDLRTTGGDATVFGRVVGSPRYLAPEVVPGHPGDARRDVYALGCILRELWSNEAEAPPELKDLALVCIAPDPNDRPDDASVVAEALRSWLDGLARRRRADASVEAALPLLADAGTLRSNALQLQKEATKALDGVHPWSPLADKVHAWAMEDQAAELEVEAQVLETRYEQGLRAALDHDPYHPEVLTRIATLYQTQLLRAEASEARPAVARLRTLLEDHDGGRFRNWLEQGGLLTLITEPAGAQVHLERYVERDRQMVPERVGELGTTPLIEVPLARGSWRLCIEHPDTDPVTYPVWIERGTNWTGCPPDGQTPKPIVLPPRGALSKDDCFVPAGWFVSGGDPDAGDGLPRALRWLDSVVVRRFPVTVAEYTTFLDARRAHGEDLDSLVPAAPSEAGQRPLLAWVEGRWQRTEFAVGPREIEPNWPVTSISWHAATAYAEWVADQQGLPWRLPHDQEWEKAARGVDGRPFAWGRFLDGQFACTLASHASTPKIHRVGAFAADVSPYGIRDMVGNVREWCRNGYRREGPGGPRIDLLAPPEGPYRMMRGGAFSSQASSSRTASRLVAPPGDRALTIGFRLVRSVS
ncbi:MAG: bifunctional serine/threonine-protein kinase/formylglycine-generating enzyme family protein [Myxococcota bacterium]